MKLEDDSRDTILQPNQVSPLSVSDIEELCQTTKVGFCSTCVLKAACFDGGL